MSAGVRRLLVDASPGERRGVVLLDGRPEHLLIERDGPSDVVALGARLVGRVGAWAGEQAFVQLHVGPPGLMKAPPGERPAQGAAVEAAVAAEAWRDKGPRLRWIGPSEGPPRPLAPPPPLHAQLAALAPGVEIERGDLAREAADLAEEAALSVEHRFRAGLRLVVEPTSALTAVDVDVAAGQGASAARIREANLSAVRHAVRLLRLKSLGGTAAIDLAGFPDAGLRGLYRAEAARALAADGPDADAAPPDRFGVLMLSRPRARRPVEALLRGPARRGAAPRSRA